LDFEREAVEIVLAYLRENPCKTWGRGRRIRSPANDTDAGVLAE
jgi:hypothetical protein